MSLGALAFLNPWLLAGLATLPLIYLLLRTVPPRPRQVEFPATRILVGIENEEKTAATTPWWLLLIRLLAAALVILALAQPVLKPEQALELMGSGPVVIVIDNGWSGASTWARRKAMADRFISEAQGTGRGVMIAETAGTGKARTLRIEAPAAARSTLQGLEPRPFAPNRAQTLAQISDALAAAKVSDPSIAWLQDGIDHGGDAAAFGAQLSSLAGAGTFGIVADDSGREAMGLVAGLGPSGALTAKIVRTGGPERSGIVHAFSARGQRLAEAPFTLKAGETTAETSFELPLELRNQVARIEIAAEASAGAVSLLDGRSQWQRVGVISGESQEQSQPLLGPLYYIEKALLPYAEIVKPSDQNMMEGVSAILKQNASVLVLADVGTISGDLKTKVEDWVKKGGVLVRFAGPRLENGGDDLLPVALRTGGRSLGGALSWSSPQPLAAFDETSLFAGLTAPKDVTISRQVLADPAQLTPEIKVWARLQDGTPLVTAVSRGAGQIVLFHVTANSEWSSLPMSGLFVEMLKRITGLGTLAGQSGESADASSADAGQASRADVDVLPPVLTLDGFGILKAPPPTAEAIPAAKLMTTLASLEHPPGYYGPAGSPRSLNIITPQTVLQPLPSPPQGTSRFAYEAGASLPLMPALLTGALALVLADMVAVLVLMGLMAPVLRALTGGRARTAMVLALALSAGLSLAEAPRAYAGDATSRPSASDALAQKATEAVTLGYVMTGDAQADATSKAGLSGLSRVLASRTAVEPGEPMGVDIETDEIAFFPVLYWPVTEDAKPLPQPTLAKIDAFMKQGRAHHFRYARLWHRAFGQSPLGQERASAAAHSGLA